MTLGDEDKTNQTVIEKLKKHRLTTTCVCVDSKDEFAYSASKDGSIIKWDLTTCKPVKRIEGSKRKQLRSSGADNQEAKPPKRHVRHINCLAISSDDQYLVSGGWDKFIRVWNPSNLKLVHTFTGHRDEITGLVFRQNHLQLYSSAKDKSVKLWTLEEEDNKAYIESLFGHESSICSIDALKKERILTAGGRDQSLRLWKIVEQAQTVFTTEHESVDIAKMIDDKTFISGGEDGSLALWTTAKRESVCKVEKAHRLQDVKNIDEFKNKIVGMNLSGKDTSFWITSLATFVKPINLKNITTEEKEDVPMDVDDDDEDRDGNNSDASVDIEKPKVDAKKSSAIYVASGSCNSFIKIWQVTIKGSQHSMKFVKSIECPGVINDLYFTKDGKKLVAAIGQEHRFGRWWKLRGVKNNVRIFDTNIDI